MLRRKQQFLKKTFKDERDKAQNLPAPAEDVARKNGVGLKRTDEGQSDLFASEENLRK